MEIEIPTRHYKYLKMLVKAELYPNEEIASLYAYKRGLKEFEEDASLRFKHFLDQELLDGKQMSLDIMDHIDFSYSLVKLSEYYNESKSLIATNIFLKGLFDHYLELKDCKLYASDKEFRNEVDMMPHLAWYDIEEDLDSEL